VRTVFEENEEGGAVYMPKTPDLSRPSVWIGRNVHSRETFSFQLREEYPCQGFEH
jgi:hypothetical protein